MILFLFVSAAQAAEEASPGFSMGEIWAHSGPIARIVIVMLIFMFLGTIFTSIERWLAFQIGRAHV